MRLLVLMAAAAAATPAPSSFLAQQQQRRQQDLDVQLLIIYARWRHLQSYDSMTAAAYLGSPDPIANQLGPLIGNCTEDRYPTTGIPRGSTPYDSNIANDCNIAPNCNVVGPSLDGPGGSYSGQQCLPDPGVVSLITGDRSGTRLVNAICAVLWPVCSGSPYCFVNNSAGANMCAINSAGLSSLALQAATYDSSGDSSGGPVSNHLDGPVNPSDCDEGWQKVWMTDGTSDCLECPFPDRCDGTTDCSEGAVGLGCAYCADGSNASVWDGNKYYQSGLTCSECPGSGFVSLLIQFVAGAVLFYLVIRLIWSMSIVHIAAAPAIGGEQEIEEGGELAGALEAVEGVQGDIDTAVELKDGIAGVSSTTVVLGIALPSLFNISITFSLPFRFPSILAGLSRWVSSFVSFDIGRLGSPECSMGATAPLTTYAIKFFGTHVGFGIICVLLWYIGRKDEIKRLHSMNARIAAFTMAVGGLIKSCASVIACQEEVLNRDGAFVTGQARVVLIALPDEECWTSAHWFVAFFGFAGLVFYIFVVPFLLYRTVKLFGKEKPDNDKLQACGWLLLKYKPSRWWFEFALIFDKTLFVIFAVFFSSERSTILFLNFNLFVAALVVLLVVKDKPFVDSDQGIRSIFGRCSFGMGTEDQIFVLSKILQAVSFILGHMCYSNAITRKEEFPPQEGLHPGVEFIVAVVGLGIIVLQIYVVYWVDREAKKNEEAEEDSGETVGANKEDDEDSEMQPIQNIGTK